MNKMERVNAVFNHHLFKENLQKIDDLEKERMYCKHSLPHFLDVARIAYIINLEIAAKISKEIIYTVALLHDIGRAYEYLGIEEHDTASKKIAEEVMRDCGFSKSEISMAIYVIENHREKEKKEIFCENDVEKLNYCIKEGDKLSRPCYKCSAITTCKWSDEKKNMKITI